MNKIIKNIVIPSAFLVLGACAKPTVVEVVMPGDEDLSCPELRNAYAETQNYKRAAGGEKGFTTGNVVRGIVFWPAIIGTNTNSNEAIQAAESRSVHLINIMRSKGCDGINNL